MYAPYAYHLALRVRYSLRTIVRRRDEAHDDHPRTSRRITSALIDAPGPTETVICHAMSIKITRTPPRATGVTLPPLQSASRPPVRCVQGRARHDAGSRRHPHVATLSTRKDVRQALRRVASLDGGMHFTGAVEAGAGGLCGHRHRGLRVRRPHRRRVVAAERSTSYIPPSPPA